MHKCLWLVVCGATVLGAQDAPRAATLKVPSRAPVVADAAMEGDVAAVRAAIAKGADVNVAQGDGMTALHWAAEHADSAMTATLLRAKANVSATTRIAEYTPLHIAARAGAASIARSLLAAGADARALTSSRATALHFAGASGDASIVN